MDSVSNGYLKRLVEHNAKKAGAFKIIEDGLKEDVRVLVDTLLNQQFQLRELYMKTLEPQEIKVSIEAPTEPIDVFHTVILNYLDNCKPDFLIWKNYSVAQIIYNLKEKKPLGGEFIQDLLDTIFRQENFNLAKEEVYNPETHKFLTDQTVKKSGIYILIKILHLQLNRVALLAHQQSGRVDEQVLKAHPDLKALAIALVKKFDYDYTQEET